MFSTLINAGVASLNFGIGIYYILQPEFPPVIVALCFAITLFCTLLTLALIKKS